MDYLIIMLVVTALWSFGVIYVSTRYGTGKGDSKDTKGGNGNGIH